MFDYKKKCIIFLTLSAFLQAEFQILDQGHTIVSGPIGDTMITHCDVFEKTDLNGTLMPLDLRIKMEIIRQEVINDKMPIDDAADDKYIANIQKIHNLSMEDIEDIAAQCHMTFLEFKKLLKDQNIYQFFLYHKFRSHLVPTDQAVEEYCKEHPEVESGYCTIQVAFAEYVKDNKDQIRAKLDAAIADETQSNSIISWSDPIKVDIDNIADDKLFIKDLLPGQISVVDDKSAFEIYRLVDKAEERLVPVQDRKAIVIDLLNRQMYEELLSRYEEHMRDNVAIINLTE